MNLTAISFLTILLCLCGCSDESTGYYLNQKIAGAISKLSTAPAYIVVTVVDDSTGQEESVCCTGWELLGALSIEKHYPDEQPQGWYEDKGIQEFALKNNELRFHFKTKEAINWIKKEWSMDIYNKAIGEFGALNREELLEQLNDINSPLCKFYVSKYDEGSSNYALYRAAVAHVLIEKQIRCGITCIYSTLWVDEN